MEVLYNSIYIKKSLAHEIRKSWSLWIKLFLLENAKYMKLLLPVLAMGDHGTHIQVPDIVIFPIFPKGHFYPPPPKEYVYIFCCVVKLKVS